MTGRSVVTDGFGQVGITGAVYLDLFLIYNRTKYDDLVGITVEATWEELIRKAETDSVFNDSIVAGSA